MVAAGLAAFFLRLAGAFAAAFFVAAALLPPRDVAFFRTAVDLPVGLALLRLTAFLPAGRLAGLRRATGFLARAAGRFFAPVALPALLFFRDAGALPFRTARVFAAVFRILPADLLVAAINRPSARFHRAEHYTTECRWGKRSEWRTHGSTTASEPVQPPRRCSATTVV